MPEEIQENHEGVDPQDHNAPVGDPAEVDALTFSDASDSSEDATARSESLFSDDDVDHTAPAEPEVSGEGADDVTPEAVEPVAPAVEAENAAATDVATEAEAKPAEDDPAAPATIKRKLRSLPGKWYVLHTYAGYEKRVKQNLEIRMKSMNMEDYLFQVEIPMEEVFEVKGGERKLVTRVRMPGYALVRMEMEDDAWRTVQETQGVTGFVGNGRTPVALTLDEVVSMLTPSIEAEQAAKARAAGKPVKGETPIIAVDFAVGENVILTTEPWVGMPATISAVDAVNQRLTVLMTLVGQETPVDLSFSQVKKSD